MLKVLYMIPAEKFGGVERQGTIAVKALPDFGIEATPLVGPGKMITEALENKGVKNYIFTDSFPDDPKHPLTFLENIQRWQYNFKCFQKSRKLILDILQKEHFDLIYATRTFSWIISGFVKRKTGIPVMWRCGSRLNSSFEKFIVHKFINFSKPNGLVLTCNAMLESFGEKPSVPTHIVWHSVDQERFNPNVNGDSFKEKFKLKNDYRYVGLAARPAPEKGPEFIIEILKSVLKKDKSIKFLWAGESSWRQFIENMFKDAGLSDHIIFLGHIADTEKFYAACDVVLLTPKVKSIETTPNSLLEPMAMGKAVIGTDVGGIPEIITNGESGFIVKYGDANTFAEKIIELLSNKSLSDKIGNVAIKRILKNHNEVENIGHLADIFKKTLEMKDKA